MTDHQQLASYLTEHLANLDQLRTELSLAQNELDLARSEAENILGDAQRRANEIITDAGSDFNEVAEKYRVAIREAVNLVQPSVLTTLGHTAPKNVKLPKSVTAPDISSEAA
ncbi:hypothetical protein Srot_0887 [Segniliparus rotundus DSM 44985]|uniref:Uncharacterized protein n=1 Tax=Segniliparus rotundus (strain ATCC BAA-972 / CDC 1076 / CIP 108378 / DSM 44985 / JCM 13578) TaxID=640132 RepID=D6ZE84_SEGRD|nr:hypothetical protein [Segniliparus rotundus]ADG97364.1 hypothetical protein Srot_0887 [Segniliparus rotundus DSM 44985]